MVKHLEQTLAKWEEKIITFMKKRFLSKLKINNFCKIEKSEWKWLSLQIFKQVQFKYIIPYGMLFNDFK